MIAASIQRSNRIGLVAAVLAIALLVGKLFGVRLNLVPTKQLQLRSNSLQFALQCLSSIEAGRAPRSAAFITPRLQRLRGACTADEDYQNCG